MVRNNIIIRIIQLCIIPKDDHLDIDHWSPTTGVVEQCLLGLRRFDPSPLLSEFQVGQKVDPCLLGLVLRPTQYTKYKSRTYKVQTKEENMVKNICSQVAHASALTEWFFSSIGERNIGSANYNKSSNGNRKGNNTSNHLGEFINISKKSALPLCTGVGGFGDASSASLYTFTQKKLQKTASAGGILLKLFMEAVGQ